MTTTRAIETTKVVFAFATRDQAWAFFRTYRDSFEVTPTTMIVGYPSLGPNASGEWTVNATMPKAWAGLVQSEFPEPVGPR